MPTVASRRGLVATLVIATLLLWLHRFNPPTALGGVGVDPSWRLANVWFLLTRAQAGVDYVLTCGPLGLVEWGTYHPRTFWPVTLLWQGLFELGAALTFTLLALRLGSWPGRVAALVIVILLDVFIGAHALLLMLGATLLALDADRWRRLALTWAALVISAYGALKFSYSLFALPCATAIALEAGLTRGVAAALRRAGLLVAVFGVVWTVVLGQSPGNVFAYALNGWQISSGYGEALSQPAPTHLIALALVVSAAALGALALFARVPVQRPRRAVAAGLIAVGLFLGFKMSFTRHGGADTFFAFATQLPILVWGSHLATRPPVQAHSRTRPLLAALAVTFVAAFAGLKWIPQVLARRPLLVVTGQVERLRINLGALKDLRGHAAKQERTLEALREELDLPQIRAALDGHEVDLLGIEQARLLLNDLAWHPRPVFHGYHTYTPVLRDLNLEAFLAPQYPRHVLVKPYTIGEDRFAHQEEPDLLRLVARDYRPLLEEQGFLLLERVAPAGPLDPDALETLFEREVAPGEWVELPAAEEEARVLFVDWSWTLAGRGLGLAYHYPRVDLVWELEDGSKGRGRITPTVTREGILLDPLLESLDDWRVWYAGERGRRMRRLKVEVEPWAAFALNSRVGLRVTRDPSLRR